MCVYGVGFGVDGGGGRGGVRARFPKPRAAAEQELTILICHVHDSSLLAIKARDLI